MAFSFAELLKKQFPMAELGVDTRSSNRMPESSPFPSESALSAFGTGGLIDALSGVSMADYFNNDNYEMRPTEASPKRGEDVLRPYRMRPGDKTTTEIDKNGNEVVTEKRVSPLTTSAQTSPLGEGPVGDSTAIFRNEFEDGRMPTNTVYPRPTTRSMYNRPDEYDRMASMPTSFDGPGIRAQPVQQGMQDEIGRIMMSNDISEMIPSRSRMPDNPSYQGGMGGQGYIASGRMPTNTVYPRPTTRSMYDRPVNSPDLMGGQGSVNNTGYSGTYGVPMYGQPRPTSAQASPIINSLLAPELGDTAQSEMNRMPTLIAQGEDGAFPPLGSNVYGLDEGMFDEDPDDERRRLLGELLRQYYQTNGRTYTSGI